LRPYCNRLVGQKMSCKFLIASTYDYIRNTCLWLLVLGCFIIIYLQYPCLTDFMNYLIHATPVHPSLCLQYFILLFTIATITSFILLILLLFHYYHHYKTVATDKPLRTSLFPSVAELITHLLRLTNILWLSLCRINKFGFYFPRRLLRSPILVGHQDYFLASLPGSIALFISSLTTAESLIASSTLVTGKNAHVTGIRYQRRAELCSSLVIGISDGHNYIFH
jgi:hypothetical protein